MCWMDVKSVLILYLPNIHSFIYLSIIYFIIIFKRYSPLNIYYYFYTQYYKIKSIYNYNNTYLCKTYVYMF